MRERLLDSGARDGCKGNGGIRRERERERERVICEYYNKERVS